MFIEIKDVNHVRYLTLNRPKAMNTMTYEFIQQLVDAFDICKRDEHIRIVVLSGSGRAFCAGDDLKGMDSEKEPTPGNAQNAAEKGYLRVVKAIRSLNKPVIAKAHGFALGAGLDILLACDFIIAEEKTKVGLVFVKRGLVSGTALLSTLLPYQKVTEILFLGTTFDMAELHRLNLIYKMVPLEQLEQAVDDLIILLTENSFFAIGLTKRVLNENIGQTLQERFNSQNVIVSNLFHSTDMMEGMQSFVEKRLPNYTDV
ncbi:enoyl-CoA hydratase/isomerase family protein [Kurthia sibirica]|uniref:Enoyl-CoA hydratase/isomerase family protein n=1 Tax=Kurthia sibirica TaxID=202750 RepID=A0A2U3ALP7_9BACL|nr:enoyl-CoA hydratase-related protein [Kurthia sibirica]PWI25430.1 hypothetical protein DEX24_08820 [Kurthia sibirica]GEK34335.1 enoyl-CoA hydratase [Kurthia sibirica]